MSGLELTGGKCVYVCVNLNCNGCMSVHLYIQQKHVNTFHIPVNDSALFSVKQLKRFMILKPGHSVSQKYHLAVSHHSNEQTSVSVSVRHKADHTPGMSV